MMHSKTFSSRQSGVTLIELLTVMIVLAVLSTIAVSSYRNYVLRAQRTDARSALLRIQVAQEKHFLQNNTYIDDIVSAPPAGLGLGSDTTPGGHYTIKVTADAGGTLATSYVATVTATGKQTQDKSDCHVFTLNDRGQRAPEESTGCWR